jgi:tight adherence protein B
MLLVVYSLSFCAASTAAFLGFSFVHAAIFGEDEHVHARIEDEFRKPNPEAATSVFINLDRIAFNEIEPGASILADDFLAPTVVPKPPFKARVESLIEKSDLKITLKQLAGTAAALGIALALASYPLGSLFAALVCAVVGAGIPVFYLRFRVRQRRERYISQLPTAFDLMSRVLRSGQSVNQALQAVGDTCPPPIAQEFSNCQKQQNFGLAPELTYKQMADRSGILEVQIFVMAMAIQRQTGGNLAEVLDRLANLLRERRAVCKGSRFLFCRLLFSPLSW